MIPIRCLLEYIQKRFTNRVQKVAIETGQSIPKGLHIRINFETGVKEAKLLDPMDSAERSISPSSSALLDIKENHNEASEAQETNEKESIYSPEELKRMLEKIKSDENLPPIDETDLNRVKEKFKDYEQLKKELGDINLSAKTDAELLVELTNNYKNIISNNILTSDVKNEEILNILYDIEYLVHQIDNAHNFISSDSFDEMIYKNLNNTDVKIKIEALKILGSSVQNNAKVQIRALEKGAVEKVTRLLALETNDDVKLPAVYSLSGLLRRFPLAQNEFLKNGGLNVFVKIFTKPENIKLQLKVITLMYDLLIEQKEASEDTGQLDFHERNKQYMLVDLENNLLKNGWCEIFNNVLIDNLSIEDIDHDAVERCLNIMLLLTDNCSHQFSNTKLLNKLSLLKKNYQTLEKDEDSAVSSYFSYLKDLTHNLIKIIHNYKHEL